jgi:putative tricarboxylic transport membrane protein
MLQVLNPMNILLMAVGVFYGIIFGSIPGLSSSVAVALIIPLTFGMQTAGALNLLIAVYVGGVSGGLISAILLRIPGTPSSIVTVLDGYPLAQQGHGGKALGTAIFASFFGGMLSALILFFLTPYLAKVTLAFSPFDYFGVTVFSLSLVSMLMEGNVIKGIITTLLGILLSFVGTSPIDGRVRFAFGNHNLDNGFNIITVIIGIFAVSEMLLQVSENKKTTKIDKFEKSKGFFPSFSELKFHFSNMIRSGLIGTFIGILPGLSGPEAALISYSQAKRSSKHPEKFGKGSYEGLVASETSNNAVSGGALIPMLSLGVPGNAVAAIIMGGFIIHGVEAGPMLFTTSPDLVRSIMIGLLVANVLMLVIETLAIRGFIKILSMPKHILYPVIIVFCVLGVTSINNQIFDVVTMLFLGLLGYVLERNKYPLGPLVLGFILGPIIELNYRRSIMYYGSFSNTLTSGFRVGTFFLIFAISVPLVKIVLAIVRKHRQTKGNVTEEQI